LKLSKITYPWPDQTIREVIISGVRIVFLVTLDRSYVDVTWDLAIPAVMTGIEVTLGTVCGMSATSTLSTGKHSYVG